MKRSNNLLFIHHSPGRGVGETYDSESIVVGSSESFGSERLNWLVKTDSSRNMTS
jgi:hypothetical protein|tara:strand:- start:67 stop:231 length:165 start_codon:yes stop_codon:yes gene_type:complete